MVILLSQVWWQRVLLKFRGILLGEVLGVWCRLILQLVQFMSMNLYRNRWLWLVRLWLREWVCGGREGRQKEGNINFINNWFLGCAWEPISRGSASSIGEKKRRQSLRECVPRQSLGTSTRVPLRLGRITLKRSINAIINLGENIIYLFYLLQPTGIDFAFFHFIVQLVKAH